MERMYTTRSFSSIYTRILTHVQPEREYTGVRTNYNERGERSVSIVISECASLYKRTVRQRCYVTSTSDRYRTVKQNVEPLLRRRRRQRPTTRDEVRDENDDPNSVVENLLGKYTVHCAERQFDKLYMSTKPTSTRFSLSGCSFTSPLFARQVRVRACTSIVIE